MAWGVGMTMSLCVRRMKGSNGYSDGVSILKALPSVGKFEVRRAEIELVVEFGVMCIF